jgi:Uncharacterized protein conserved in bacteria (DUF2057)
MKRPALLRHPGILTHWRDYPEGSVERAKALGLEVLFTFQRVETTLELWETEKQVVEHERPWVTLGLSSRDAFIQAITGHTERAADAKISKTDAIRHRRGQFPRETQQQTAAAVGCTQAWVSQIITRKRLISDTPLKRLQHWWQKATATQRRAFLEWTDAHRRSEAWQAGDDTAGRRRVTSRYSK